MKTNPFKIVGGLIFVLFFSNAFAQTSTVNVVYINGIQNTLEDAIDTRNRINTTLATSTNHTGTNKKAFSVTAVWNPIGWNGSDEGSDLKQDKMELFLLKTAEEKFASDFRTIMFPHNPSVPKSIDKEAATRVKAYLDDMTPGGNSLETSGKITDENMKATKKAALALAERVKVRGSAVVVAHSQGNLLANLAYSKLASEFGSDVSKMVRVVNVANTSEFSVNNLNFTHAGDAALFSAATSIASPDQSLETMPSRGSNWTRTTPRCANNGACNFAIAAATLNSPSSNIPDQGVVDEIIDHSIVLTYLSTATVTIHDNQGITFSQGAERFVDRFEDFVYVAANSLIISGGGGGTFTLSITKTGSGTVTSTPEGIACGSSCTFTSAPFPSGQPVSLNAVADNGFTFAGWSGACTNTTGPCNVDMTSNKSVQATFTPTGGGGGGGLFDFAFAAGPASQTVAQGSVFSFGVWTTLTSGTAQTVSLGFVGCPGGATCFFDRSTVTPTSVGSFTVSTANTTPEGTSTITLTATAGLLLHQVTVQVSVTAAGGGQPPPPPSPPPGGGGGSATAGTWTATGNLISARSLHTATLLPNGKVLAAGGGASGMSNVGLASAELYDPVPGTWITTGNLATARGGHTATVLSNGKVLVASGLVLASVGDGGVSSTGVLSSAELYDPATGVWASTGNLRFGRCFHTATLLPNGKVLVAGSNAVCSAVTDLSTADLYDPATGAWTSTGNLSNGRGSHTATLLPNGKVLAAGGASVPDVTLGSAELYDPVTGIWTGTGSLVTKRSDHTATLLPSGKVLVVGGVIIGSTGGVLSSAELYDPATGTWTSTGNLITGRGFHTATLLPNGKVLVAGGTLGSAGTTSSAELYDPVTGTWTPAGNLITGRVFHTATLLPNGKVLAAGGSASAGSLAFAELYDPGDVVTLTVTKAGSGSGTVTSSPPGIDCGTACSVAFAPGTSVVLTANPPAGSTFGGWSGACTGTGTCTVSMTEAKAVVATFTVEASGGGTVEGIVKSKFAFVGTEGEISGAKLEFRDSSGSLITTTTSNASGAYSVGGLPAGTYKITATWSNPVVTAAGFVDTDLTVEVQANRHTVANPLVMVQTANGFDTTSPSHGIDGELWTSYADGQCFLCAPFGAERRVGGGTVQLRRGLNNRTGPVVASTTSFSGGEYFFGNLEAGSYTATVSKTGYFTESFPVFVDISELRFPVQHAILAPVLNIGEVRIVLTWGGVLGFEPDLEAHLTGPLLGSSQRFHVFLGSIGNLAKSPFAQMEAAQRGSPGPETFKISQRVAGTYRFSVHDDSNRTSTTSSALSTSRAQVRVYVGESNTSVIFNVPPARPGTLWTVFEMDGITGVITPVNSLTFVQDPAAVQ